MILPDHGLSIHARCAAENAAHSILLRVFVSSAGLRNLRALVNVRPRAELTFGHPTLRSSRGVEPSVGTYAAALVIYGEFPDARYLRTDLITVTYAANAGPKLLGRIDDAALD